MPEAQISKIEHELALRKNKALKDALDHEVRRRCGLQGYIARLERNLKEKEYVQTVFLDPKEAGLI
jgi:hypothetical protein